MCGVLARYVLVSTGNHLRGRTMKHLNMLGLAAVAAAALMAFVGASTATATTLTSGATAMKVGDEIHAINSGTGTLTTTYKNITCTESTVKGVISNAGGVGVEASASIEKQWLTWGGCNCEVKTLAGGAISINGEDENKGTVTSNGAEVTTTCNSTLFGTVHCIYSTFGGTDLGTLKGGTGAKIEMKENNIPRLTTNALCAEKAHWDATYVVDSPATLNVDT